MTTSAVPARSGRLPSRQLEEVVPIEDVSEATSEGDDEIAALRQAQVVA
ncbi:MAG TPA: hypothetical protein VMT79_05550 [Candidatus Binatia bacterium]|nr:hypothetical protein [Candidatus Binatia bacterium]